MLTFVGQLRGLDPATVARRAQELLEVMGLTDAERTLIADYSTGMRKKIGLATALLHAPRLLVLYEPFEAMDPVSAASVKTILALVEQLCDTVAVLANGTVAVAGPLSRVRDGRSLEETFVQLVGPGAAVLEGLSWLAS